MTRRLSNIITFVSLTVGIALAALFVRSFIRYDELQWYAVKGERASFWIASSRGEFCINTEPDESGDHDVERGWHWHSSKPMSMLVLLPGHSVLERLGFGVVKTGSGRAGRLGPTLLLLPDWPFLIAIWLLPLARLNQWRLRRRSKRRLLMGLCPCCNYDLRASEETCPECGASITANVAKGG
jgi:hypothetical protein